VPQRSLPGNGAPRLFLFAIPRGEKDLSSSYPSQFLLFGSSLGFLTEGSGDEIAERKERQREREREREREGLDESPLDLSRSLTIIRRLSVLSFHPGHVR